MQHIFEDVNMTNERWRTRKTNELTSTVSYLIYLNCDKYHPHHNANLLVQLWLLFILTLIDWLSFILLLNIERPKASGQMAASYVHMRCLSKVLSCLERTTLGRVIYLLMICNSALVFLKNIINKWSFRYCAFHNLGISTFGERCSLVETFGATHVVYVPRGG